MTDDFPDLDYDAETGMPILPAQRAIGYATLVDDLDGSVVAETVILPNLIVFFEHMHGVRIGNSMMLAGTALAHKAAEVYLPERARQVTACDCKNHSGRTMVVEDVAALNG